MNWKYQRVKWRKLTPFQRKYDSHTLQLRPWCKGHDYSTPSQVQSENTRSFGWTSAVQMHSFLDFEELLILKRSDHPTILKGKSLKYYSTNFIPHNNWKNVYNITDTTVNVSLCQKHMWLLEWVNALSLKFSSIFKGCDTHLVFTKFVNINKSDQKELAFSVLILSDGPQLV